MTRSTPPPPDDDLFFRLLGGGLRLGWAGIRYLVSRVIHAPLIGLLYLVMALPAAGLLVQHGRLLLAVATAPPFPPVAPLWPLPVGETRLPSISGASPGGAASLVIFPEHDLAFAAFGNASGAAMLSDRLVLWLLHDYLGLDLPDLLSTPVAVSDLSPYEGTYCSNQLRVEVQAVDGQLEERLTYEPLDDAQARIFAGFSGGQFPFPARRLVPVGDGLFAPAGVPLEALKGYMRVMLVSFHGRINGHATHRTTGGRMTRRPAGST